MHVFHIITCSIKTPLLTSMSNFQGKTLKKLKYKWNISNNPLTGTPSILLPHAWDAALGSEDSAELVASCPHGACPVVHTTKSRNGDQVVRMSVSIRKVPGLMPTMATVEIGYNNLGYNDKLTLATHLCAQSV